MDPLASRLSKLSVSRTQRPNRQNRGQGRKRGKGRETFPPGPKTQASGSQAPVTGKQTPASGVTTPGSGIASRSSGLNSPNYGSEFDTENEEEDEEEIHKQPFPFFGLPYELRQKILRFVMGFNDTVDLNVNATWRVRMMPASRQFYEECSKAFYGSNKFRLLPLDGPVFKKRTRPLIQFFSARNRGYITRLELRLGPHWLDPPRCWEINEKLGIEDLVSLRRLDILVQCDPEHPSFSGFRRSKEFYTQFCGDLLNKIVQRAPKLETVYIDSWPAVGRDSPLLRRLEEEATIGNKKILWGPHLKLDNCFDVVAHPANGISVYDTVVIRQMIMAEE